MKLKLSRLQGVRGGFSLTDMIVISVLFVLLGGWFVFTHSGERARIARCAGNLQVLGQAMGNYANANNDEIPPAAVSLPKVKTSWDLELAPYVKPGAAKMYSAYDKKQQLAAWHSLFLCPSDHLSRPQPRSYAMSAHNMDFWPPGPDDPTGLGLLWNSATLMRLGSAVVKSNFDSPELLPRLKLSLVPQPADTVLLTEFPAQNNRLAGISGTSVSDVRDQQQGLHAQSSKFHRGRFNYLMVDGHVELLSALQTGDLGGGPAGIWTIKSED
jgi:prepilin-type processing-associated H-X9-DG protein